MSPPGHYRPTVSIVIPTCNRPEQLDQCLAAVARLDYPRLEVVVVNNAPRDAQAKGVAERRGARYTVEPVCGVSRARNRGARASEAEIVAYLDDDFLPEPTWLSALIEEFADPQVMAVSGRIRALGDEPEAEELCALIGGPDFGGLEQLKVDSRNPSWFELANFGGIVPGGNMAFRRSAFEVWPGFNEQLGRGTILHGGEEQHAFFSLIDRGYRAVYTPRAVVRHPLFFSEEEIRTRYLKDMAASAAYMMLLFMEEPRHRSSIIKYVTEALRGKSRTWRTKTISPRLVPKWRVLCAWLSGPSLYIRSRLAHTPSNNHH
jgi:O-antigen biosynthesis protein